jgi:RNA polymerase sigma factor (sigma-70 family)
VANVVDHRQQMSDASLILAVRQGDNEAGSELFRRHHGAAVAAARALSRSAADADDIASEAFGRVLRAIRGGGGPEVAFRPYLLSTVRNVFYDQVRRRREEPTDEVPEPGLGGVDMADRLAEAGLAGAAFASLPERWQLVLWHTEVEGLGAAEVAPMLGIAPNAAAALAYRAREGLRQAYLQAHLRTPHEVDCQRCAESLGAYVRDGLSARDRRRVDAHVDHCDSCRALVAELTDTNSTLRAALIPVLVGVPVAAYLSGARAGVVAGARGWLTGVLAGATSATEACLLALLAATTLGLAGDAPSDQLPSHLGSGDVGVAVTPGSTLDLP